MLFDPGRHEPLGDTAWDEPSARAAIRAIVADVEQNRLAPGHWPVHPQDDDGGGPTTGFKSLYLGSAGVLWALWYLQREGAAQLGRDPCEGIERVHAAYLAEPDTGEVLPSYLLGESGILLLLWRMTGSRTAADALFASVRSNIGNPANEALWAAPGTMVAAWHLWAATGEERWRALFVDNVEQVWHTWLPDERAGCDLWTQVLYGRTVQFLGAGHGFAGNVYPLLKGAALLDADRRESLFVRCLATLRATAKTEDDAVNWPRGTYSPRPDEPMLQMQWCHGAPGIVTGCADFPAHASSEMESLLLGAGQAIWNAGPLAKGYGLCHGTAGNGYAFLKLYRRTGDILWLERARSFAMHAIEQKDRLRAQSGQGRYSLWTGDAGLAIYLWHCIEGTAELPALDAV